ncbi:MAG: hypothetical protein M5U28_14535 [Sandaracinaceae bacterium]|nr:hypothetical protein [Sandaracinaceae bacterium]
MKLAAWASAAVTCALLTATGAVAQDQDDVGSVRLPLSRYEALTRGGGTEDGARHAFSDVAVTVSASEDGSAEVSVSASVRVIGEGVALVPLVSSGAALTSATANGRDAELVPQHGALAWPSEAGTHRLAWSYRVDARRYGDGRVLSIATPAASGRLTADLPGSDPGVTVIPASSIDVTASGDRTRVSASLPATGAVQIAWRVAGAGGYTLSRARYRGRLAGDTVRFEAELTVELAGGERVLVPLFPQGVALEDVQVDRTEAAIAVIEETGSFAVPVAGRGPPPRGGDLLGAHPERRRASVDRSLARADARLRLRAAPAWRARGDGGAAGRRDHHAQRRRVRRQLPRAHERERVDPVGRGGARGRRGDRDARQRRSRARRAARRGRAFDRRARELGDHARRDQPRGAGAPGRRAGQRGGVEPRRDLGLARRRGAGTARPDGLPRPRGLRAARARGALRAPLAGGLPHAELVEVPLLRARGRTGSAG